MQPGWAAGILPRWCWPSRSPRTRVAGLAQGTPPPSLERERGWDRPLPEGPPRCSLAGLQGSFLGRANPFRHTLHDGVPYLAGSCPIPTLPGATW